MIIIYAIAWEILRYYSYVVIAYVVLSWLVSFNVLNSQNRLVFIIFNIPSELDTICESCFTEAVPPT